MNERIRELARQAGFETEHHKWIFANDNAGEGECHELLEKFAELIVKECISKVTKVSDSIKEFDSGNADGIDLCDLITHHIKKHFGVEE